MRYVLPLLLLLSTLLTACQSEPEIIIISDNNVIPDETVPEILQENYINKLFIGLLGQKPTDQQMTEGLEILGRNNASVEGRKEIIQAILDSDRFITRMYDIGRAEMLGNLDTADITLRIAIYIQLLSDPQYEAFLPLLQAEIDNMQALKNLPQDMLNGLADRQEMHRRMAFNIFYDEINMGSQNFILSLFEYFLDRYPTESEEEIAINMVDGFGGILFGKEGNTKADFLEIFLSSTDYIEGQVIDLYNDFLLREPVSTEMSEATIVYAQAGYAEMLKVVLSKNEVLGI